MLLDLVVTLQVEQLSICATGFTVTDCLRRVAVGSVYRTLPAVVLV